MNSKVVERERLDLQENPEFLSPPVIVEPLYQCATAVTVQSYAPGAEIEIEVEGSIVATEPGGFNVPAGATGFELGLEDTNGIQGWVDSDEVGSLPRPYPRNRGMIKTMLKTLRFKGACFQEQRGFDMQRIQAILIRCDRRDERALAFDDLQIVGRRG